MFAALKRLLLAALLAGAASWARAFELPPIEGSLSGEAALTFLPGSPTAQWTTTAGPLKDGWRDVSATIEAEGLRLRLECRLRAGSADGEWTLTGGSVDLARWGAPLAGWLTEALRGAQAQGSLALSGAGHLRGGVPSGELVLHVEDAALSDASAGWRVDGIALDGAFRFDVGRAALASIRPAALGVGEIMTSRLGARNLRLTGELKDLRTFSVTSGSLEIAGGEVIAAPCEISLRPLAVESDLRFMRIGLQDLAQLLPDVVAEAQGRVDGKVRLGWSQADGFTVGAGSVALRNDEPAQLRLLRMDGLITNALSPQVLDLYPGLKQVEKGQLPLQARSMEVRYSPEGDAEGRQATVRLFGTYPGAPGPLDLTVNLRGPVESLIKMSASGKLRFSAGK